MKITALLIILLQNIVGFSQESPIKWKEIPMEDLQMTSYEFDPLAPAVILCDYGQIYFDINPNGRNLFVFYKRHIRIKILKPEGLKYAKMRIPFHNMACENLEGENPKIIKGMVYNLSESGKLIANKLKGKDIKYIDSVNCIKIAELNFPDVKPGSIIDCSYQIPTLDFVMPQSWYFQCEIPTRYSELRMRVPKAFEYIFSPQNIEDFEIMEKSFYNSSIFLNIKRYQPSPTDMSGTQIRFAKKNIEAFNYQNFITKPEDHMAKINIHLSKAIQENSRDDWRYFTHSLMITTYDDYDEYQPSQRRSLMYPAGYKLYILPDWEKFNTKLLNSTEFGLPLIARWDYQEHLYKMIDGITNPNERMLAIYDYIRKNIKWNKEYRNDVRDVHSKFISNVYTKLTNKQIKEKSLAKPFENKEGSNSEINFILIYLLNRAGIETNPVLVSTRDNGKPDQSIPEPKQFNHVLALAKIEDKQFLLDATDSLRPYQILDINSLNGDGFMVHRTDFGWIPILNNKISETNTHEIITLDTNMIFKRKTLIQETGYDALNHRKEIAKDGKESFINNYKSQHLSSSPESSIEMKNIENDIYPLVFIMSQSKNVGSQEEIRFQAKFNPVYLAEDFTESDRKFPIDFTYPFVKKYKLEIEIPKEYIVEFPKNETYSTFGENASFKYEVSLKENKIELNIELQILKSEFPSFEYNNLADLFTKLNDKLGEEIIIKMNKSVE